MARVKVGLETIDEIDGGQIKAEFNAELKRCVQDCIHRPHENKARVVLLKVKITPDPSNGIADTAFIGFEVKGTVPSLQGKNYQVAVHGSGNLMVNPASPDDIRQGTLDDAPRD